MEYTILRIVWWALIGLLLSGFAIMDGFDLGAAALLPFVARKDSERRITLNSVGPTWEGNQVWFILGGGAIFAAWPMIYATSFSGFYIAMLLVLLTFIFRPVGFKYRSKINNPTWRTTWDYILTVAGALSCILFGAAVGNVILGVPFHFDHELRSFYTGTFLQLLNPFGVFCGVVSLIMLITQGAIFLTNKTEGIVRERAIKAAHVCGPLTALLFIVGGFWVKHLPGYLITGPIKTDGPSNPLHKAVTMQTGAWFHNYSVHPWFWIAPALGILGFLIACVLLKKHSKLAIIFSSTSIAGIICTVGFSMFPFLLPSSSNPSMSLLVWDASSSLHTLEIMTGVSIVFTPIVLLYTAWVYRIMRGKVTEQTIADNHQSY